MRATRAQSQIIMAAVALLPGSAALATPPASGWATVEVYVGNVTLGDPAGSTFSQEMQDIAVQHVLGCKKNGFFLDIAAHTALRLSNTRFLERDWGWDGICVEANHDYWHELAHRKCRVVGAVLGEGYDQIKFAGAGATAHVGLADRSTSDVVRNWIRDPLKGYFGVATRNRAGGEFARATLPTDVFLDDLQVPSVIDYVSLDVEGAELSIMRRFPFRRHQIRVLIIERPGKVLTELVTANGFAYVGPLASGGGGDIMFVTPHLVPGGVQAAKEKTQEVIRYSRKMSSRSMKSYVQMSDSAPLKAVGMHDANACNLRDSGYLRMVADNRYRQLHPDESGPRTHQPPRLPRTQPASSHPTRRQG